VLTVVSPGGDANSSVMVSYYSHSDDLNRSAPASPSLCSTSSTASALCSEYFVQGLYRQHTNSGAFHNFSAVQGGAFLVSNPGYYVACVAASAKDAGSTLQDGVSMLSFQKKSVRDSRQCARPAMDTYQGTQPPSNIPTYHQYCSSVVLKASDCTSAQGVYFVETLSPLFCPPGYTYTPFGIESLTSKCPNTVQPLPLAACKVAPVAGAGAPSACSEISLLVQNA